MMTAKRLIKLGRNFSSIADAKIGIIGLGNVGISIAKNLLRAGYNLNSVLDTNLETFRELPQSLNLRRTPSEVALNSEIILTALPLPADVKDVVEGSEGLLQSLRQGSIWIDHSTTDYEQTVRLAEEVSRRGSFALEAPITGGMALLQKGKMTTLVGGDRDVFDRCKPLLTKSCSNVLYMGEIGAATITKVISNMLAGAHNVLMGEALMLAKRSNLDLNSFFDGIRLSAGNSFVFETEAPLVFNGTYDPNFSLKNHCKDLDLGYKLALTHKVPIPVHALIQQIYNEARYRYGDQKGSSSPPKLTEDSLQESLQVEGFDDWTYSIEEVTGGSLGVVHENRKPQKSRYS